MDNRMSVADYLGGEETLRRRELEWGMVRDAPAPNHAHQVLVTRLAVALDNQVRPAGLGHVVVSPIDVVLDVPRALILQPDVVFISASRRSIAAGQVWGPPDLVVEVSSPGTARRDRGCKLEWYDHYGVRECWLVLPDVRQIEVHTFGPVCTVRPYGLGRVLRSAVLPGLRVRVNEIFAE
jgi:Uma2 family endonuclease